MKKVISLILTLAILLGIALPASAAENDGVTVSLVPSKTEIAPGEQFTAEMKIDKTLKNLYCLQIKLWWDADKLTYKGGTAGTVCSNAMIEIGDPIAQTGNVFLNLFIELNSDADPFDVAAGVLGTFTFAAKEGVSGSPSLKIEYEVIGNYTDFSEVTTTIDNSAANALTIKEAPAVKGYTITASEDKDIVVGEEASVSFQVGGDQDTFNAYDLTITYDAGKLTYKSGTAADTDATIDGKTKGTVRVVGYGADKNINTNAVTLTFTGEGTGTANVKVTSAKVDIRNQAIENDAPEATLLDDTTVITIGGYEVKLDKGLAGETSVASGADYTFTATDWANYDYDISATMGGETAQVIDNKNGTYTIKNVTGNLDISATMTPKSYKVTIKGEDTTGAATATYNTAYTFTVDRKDNFTYQVAVTVGGNVYTGYTVSDNTYTIPGTDITGDIEITITKTEIPAEDVKVSFEGNGSADVKNPVLTVKKGNDYTFTLEKVEGLKYEISATMGGAAAEVIDNEDGTYTIKNVAGVLKITVTKTSDLTVDVTEYITLNEKSMYLVTVSGTIAEGSIGKYDGMAMYWSEKYNAYAWLVVSADGLEAVKAEAAGKVTIAEGTAAGTVDYSCDVNGTETVDVNDVQLTYDMYNAKYEDFAKVSMLKFLNADVSTDETSAKKLDVSDAAAIVNTILNPAT